MIRSIFIGLMVTLAVSFLMPTSSQAWGRRGHSIVCQTAAAILAAREPSGAFLKKHSFDLGYYCNVPDLIWKKPATYSIEAPQHFMDLEIFNREFKKAASAQIGNPFSSSRAQFEREHPAVPITAGRSYWRIRELIESLNSAATDLRKPSNTNQTGRFELQEKWLVTAGVVGHYVGDLAQPLHVSEDYDGQMENQNGIHAFFEDQIVDELSSAEHPGRLEFQVGELALKKWQAYVVANTSRSTLEVIQNLAGESSDTRSTILKIDKRVGRNDIRKSATALEPIIKERLAAGALATALLWSRELGWTYEGDKFFNFTGAPEYIYPPSTSGVSTNPALSNPAPAAQLRAVTPAGPTPKL